MKFYTLNNQFIKESYKIPINFTGISDNRYGDKFWWKNGKRHRIDGPAIEWFDNTVEYWINGEHILVKNIQSFILLVSIMKLKGLL